jgi:hypothetical protein
MSIEEREGGPHCWDSGTAEEVSIGVEGLYRKHFLTEVNGNVTELRLQMQRNGFQPIPASGKSTYIKGWNALTDVNPETIRLWERMCRDHTNTGILTRHTPALDIDILNEEAAEAVEWLVRERFGDDRILVRFGRPPKRAILFRTDKPFGKIVRSFDGGHKLEFLCLGQQLIANGIHPDTRRQYSWHGGAPWNTQWGDLPSITEDGARKFLDDAEALLASELGLGRSEQARASGGSYGRTSRQDLREDILAGRNLHEALTRLPASMLSGGADPHDVEHHLFELMMRRRVRATIGGAIAGGVFRATSGARSSSSGSSRRRIW